MNENYTKGVQRLLKYAKEEIEVNQAGITQITARITTRIDLMVDAIARIIVRIRKN